MPANQIPRGNPHLNEAIEMLDMHLYRYQGDIKKASQCLTSGERDFVDAEIEHCILDPRYYLENYHVVQTEDEGLKTLYPFWDSQEIFYYEVRTIQLAGKPVKVICLKARQQGLSTLSEGLVFHKTIFTETCNTLIVAQDPGQADFLFSMSRLAYDYLPWWMKPEERYQAKGRYLVLDKKDDIERQMYPGLRSQMLVEAANKMTGVARGKTIRAAHFCLSDRNPIIMRDGYMKSIAEVNPGDEIRCENYLVTVRDVCSRSAEGEPSYRITPWCNSAFPIEGTGNHRVLCAEVYRGYGSKTKVRNERMKALKDIGAGDALVVPVRPVLEDGCLPSTRPTEFRKHGGGRKARSIQLKPNREWGFAVGMYLAEGSVDKKHRRVFLSLDKDEQHLADRWCAAVGIKEGKTIAASDGSRTRVHNIYSAELARWLADNFGETETKTIPDFCWWVGREFLEGVVEGLILGDGYANKKNEIHLPSTRCQFAVGFREAVASLGFGYCGIYYRPAGNWYGRECKELWTVVAMNDTNRALRALLDLPQGPFTMKIRGRHWFYSADKKRIYVRVRKVEKIEIDLVYDIEVDSQDHTYLLPSCITHNSELASWADGGILSKAVFPTMNASDELAIMESTADGRKGFWYEFWRDCEEGNQDWHPVFIEFFRVKKYSRPIAPTVHFELTPEEKAMRAKVKKKSGYEISDETFNWRRAKIREFIKLEGDEWSFFQEYPSNAMEAFQGSGICAFPKRLLQGILESQCNDPIWFGEIEYKHEGLGATNKYKLLLTEVKSGIDLPKQEAYGGRMYVWEKPTPEDAYYIAVDVAHGVEGGDYSCIQVLKIGHGPEPDEQVCEWHGWINPTPLAHVAAAIGYWYNTAQIAVECNDVGVATNNELFRILEYENIYRWKHVDKIKNFLTDHMGWYTNHKTRDTIISKTREAIMEKTLVLRSVKLLDQMMDFSSEDGGKFEGQNTKDDRVMSLLICRYCAHDSDYGKSASSQPRTGRYREEVWEIYDPKGRKIATEKDYDKAFVFIATHSGWAMRPVVEKNKVRWVLVDGQGKKVDEVDDFEVARLIALKNKYSMRQSVSQSDFHNTDFSPVHDRPGLRQRLNDMGVPPEAMIGETLMYAQMASGPPSGENADNDWKNL